MSFGLNKCTDIERQIACVYKKFNRLSENMFPNCLPSPMLFFLSRRGTCYERVPILLLSLLVECQKMKIFLPTLTNGNILFSIDRKWKNSI